jgi:hypothetical protein
MPFVEPIVHAFHDSAYLFSIFFGKKPEAVRDIGGKKNVSLELDRPGTIYDGLPCFIVPPINKLRVPNNNTCHNGLLDSAGLMLRLGN